MQDELDRRVVRALRAGANAFTPTVTTEQVEDRLARTTSSPWQVVAAAMLSVAAAFLFVVLAVGPGRGLPIGNASPSASASPAFSLPPVTELPAGIWVSRSPFRNSTICVAIQIEQPVAARHRAWWWNPGGSGDCGSRSGPIVDAEGATDEFPIVRIEVPTILDGSETLSPDPPMTDGR